MFDGLKRTIAAKAIVSVLKSLATDKSTQTSITGLIAGAVLAVHRLDVGALLTGDAAQWAHVLAGVGVWAIGFLATKENHDGHATLIGVGAAALYSVQGSVETVITSVVIAILGYLTNKPTAGTA